MPKDGVPAATITNGAASGGVFIASRAKLSVQGKFRVQAGVEENCDQHWVCTRLMLAKHLIAMFAAYLQVV